MEKLYRIMASSAGGVVQEFLISKETEKLVYIKDGWGDIKQIRKSLLGVISEGSTYGSFIIWSRHESDKYCEAVRCKALDYQTNKKLEAERRIEKLQEDFRVLLWEDKNK